MDLHSELGICCDRAIERDFVPEECVQEPYRIDFGEEPTVTMTCGYDGEDEIKAIAWQTELFVDGEDANLLLDEVVVTYRN